MRGRRTAHDRPLVDEHQGLLGERGREAVLVVPEQLVLGQVGAGALGARAWQRGSGAGAAELRAGADEDAHGHEAEGNRGGARGARRPGEPRRAARAWRGRSGLAEEER